MKLLLINPRPKIPALVKEHPMLHLDLCKCTDAIMAAMPGVSLPATCDCYAPGLVWLGTYAQLNGIGTRIVTYDQVKENGIPKNCCIGFTATAPDIPEVLAMVKQFRYMEPKTLFALGGAHVQTCPPHEIHRLFKEGINFIDRGNGSAFIAMLRECTRSKEVDLTLQLDSSWPSLLPGIRTPDYELLGDQLLRVIPHIFTTLGCSGQCIYCSSSGTRHVRRDIAAIVEELTELANRLPEGRLVHFTDCDLLIDPSRIEGLLPLLPRSLRYSCDCHMVTARPDLLRAMWSSGFVRINLGIEDLYCNRHRLGMIQLDNIMERLQSIRSSFPGVVRGYFLVGLPGSHSDSTKPFLDGMRELLRGRIIDIATVKILVPYPGTFLHSHSREFGLTLLSSDLEFYKRLDHPVYELDGLTAEAIEQWLVKALCIARDAYTERIRDEHIPFSLGSCNYTRGQDRPIAGLIDGSSQ